MKTKTLYHTRLTACLLSLVTTLLCAVTAQAWTYTVNSPGAIVDNTQSPNRVYAMDNGGTVTLASDTPFTGVASLSATYSVGSLSGNFDITIDEDGTATVQPVIIPLTTAINAAQIKIQWQWSNNPTPEAPDQSLMADEKTLATLSVVADPSVLRFPLIPPYAIEGSSLGIAQFDVAGGCEETPGGWKYFLNGIERPNNAEVTAPARGTHNMLFEAANMAIDGTTEWLRTKAPAQSLTTYAPCKASFPVHNVFSDEVMRTEALVEGGNPDGWRYEWQDIDNLNSSTESAFNYQAPSGVTAAQRKEVTLRWYNLAPDGTKLSEGTTQQSFMVHPVPEVTFVDPTSTHLFTGSTVQFGIDTNIPLENASWEWTENGAVIGTTAKLDYTPSNAGPSPETRLIVGKLTLAPEGVAAPKVFTKTYEVTIYPLPTISGSQEKNVVFSGTEVTMTSITAGGNPDGWQYSWTRNGETIGDNSLTLTDSPINAGTSVQIFNYRLTAVNTAGAEQRTVTQDFNVNVWPTPGAAFTEMPVTEYFTNVNVPLSVTPNGGDLSKWTYEWSDNGSVIGNNSTLDYTTLNTTLSPETHTITVRATNTPDGIDQPVTITNTYNITVYPNPEIVNPVTSKPVVFSGTEISLSAETKGGNADNWSYSWTRNGETIGDNTLTLTDTPINAGTSVQTFNYRLTAVNTAGAEQRTVTQDFNVNVWPTPGAAFTQLTDTEYFTNVNVPLSVTPNGGDLSKWTYEWSDNGTVIGNNSTFDYTTLNTTLSPETHTITITATNTPEGIDQPVTITNTYNITVYPNPEIVNPVTSKPVVFSGTEISLSAETQGGKADNWSYSWTRDGQPIGDNSLTLADSPINAGTSVQTFNYRLTAVNTVGAEQRTVTQDFYVNVWPTPGATFTEMPVTEYFTGSNVPLTVTPNGGDLSKWTYEWSDNGTVIGNSSTLDYTTLNTTLSPETHTITVRATNTPDGIDQPVTITNTYNITVYPTPEIVNPVTSKPVVFSGTEISLSAETKGGNADNWSYSWTRNGETIGDNTLTLTDTPINAGTSVQTFNYRLTAVNTAGAEQRTVTQDFYVNVWPAPGAAFTEMPVTEYFTNINVPLTVTPNGGDSSKWTYEWSDNGSVIGNSSTLDYTTLNTTLSPETHTITVRATNTPDGIDQAVTITNTYNITVYPTPEIVNPVTSKPVVFSGTEISLSAETKGGNADNWSYSWTRNGETIGDNTLTLTDTPINAGTSVQTFNYRLTAVNTAGAEQRTVTQDFYVNVWPTPGAAFTQLTDTEYFTNINVPLTVTPNGGDLSKWTYEWSDNGTVIGNEPSLSYNTLNTTLSPETHTITVRATNTPDGIDQAVTLTNTYNITVYPNAELVNPVNTKPVVFSGTEISLSAETRGGNADNWSYSWTRDNQPIGDSSLSLTDSPINAGTSVQTFNYRLTAVNTVGAEQRTVTQDFYVNVWPTPGAAFTQLTDTEYFTNINVPLTVTPNGGDSSKWTYEWSDNGSVIGNNSTLDYTTLNTTLSPETHTITVRATNTPDGIDQPVTLNNTYNITVYPNAELVNPVNAKPVVFSGTEITLSAKPQGGNPDSWQYSWTHDGIDLGISTPTLTDTPIYTPSNYDTSVQTHNYRLAAVNTAGNYYQYPEQSFSVNVWPAPGANFVELALSEYFNGEQIPFFIIPNGGDPSRWTYEWSDNGTVIGNNSTLDYNAINTTLSPETHTITVKATNTPEGIDQPVTISNTYNITVYPTPEIINPVNAKPVVFSGTEITLSAETQGGKADNWSYSWTRDDQSISGNTLTLTDRPTNTGTAPQVYTYRLLATNSTGAQSRELPHYFTVTVWPTPDAVSNQLPVNEYFNGVQLPLAVTTMGGDPSRWTYQWEDNGAVIGNEPSLSYNTLNTNLDPEAHYITIRATNAPDGIDQAMSFTSAYNITVYPNPEIVNPVNAKPVVFSGTEITLSAETQGGNADNWSYSWTRDNQPIGDSSLSLTDNPTNYSSDPITYNYRLSATNVTGNESRWSYQDFYVTVWPNTTVSTSEMPGTEFFTGTSLPLSVMTGGGDPSRWTYQWEDNGTVISSEAWLNYVANNTGNEAVEHTLTVTATNTPDGIDVPSVYTRSYNFTIMPLPSITTATIDKPVIFSGTGTVMKVETNDINKDGWSFSWTRDGMTIGGNSLELADNPTSSGSGATYYNYILTATNTYGGDMRTETRDFIVTVWPSPTASFNMPTRTKWFDGDQVNLVNSVSGGDSGAWSYKWYIDGEAVDFNSPTAVLPCTNTTNNSLTGSVKVVATNAPQGIDAPYVYTSPIYEYIVYPTPTISGSQNKNVVFSGTEVTLTCASAGGNPDGWSYSWTRNGIIIGGNSPVLTDAPTNNGTAAKSFKYILTATNSAAGDVRTMTKEFTVSVWPSPSAVTSMPTRTQWFNGDQVNLVNSVSGGDSGAWSYKWYIDGVAVDFNSPTAVLPCTNTTNNPLTGSVQIVATNAPQGIDAPYVYTSPIYEYIVYPTPSLSGSQNKSVVFSGTDVTLTGVTAGGNPDGWLYSWTRNGIIIGGNSPVLTDAPTNTGTTAKTYNYVLTASNSAEGDVRTMTKEFTVSVWPSPSAVTSMPTRTQWFNGDKASFNNTVSGGDSNAWTYQWYLDGTLISHSESSGVLTCVNENEIPESGSVQIVATNAPQGIDAPYVYTSPLYEFTIYPTPSLSGSQNKSVVFSGTDVTLEGFSAGGNPDGWSYSWTRNGIIIGGNSLVLTDAPTNTGTAAKSFKYILTATNSAEGDVRTVTREFTVTVWPAPNVNTMMPKRTNWINGDSFVFNNIVNGGDSNAWTYKWYLNGELVTFEAQSGKMTFNNTSNEPVVGDVQIVVTNAPNGIDAPYVYTSPLYEYATYPSPSVEQKGFISFNGLSGSKGIVGVTATGGYPEGWQFEWTRNGVALPIETSEAEIEFINNNQDGMNTDVYQVRALHTIDGQVYIDQTFTCNANIFPTPVVSNNGEDINAYYAETVTVKVDAHGGNPDGWIYYWVEEVLTNPSSGTWTTNNLGSGTDTYVYTLPSTSSDSYKRRLRCNVRNIYGDQEWSSSQCVFPINGYSRGEVTGVNIPAHFNGTANVTLAANVKGGYPDGWTYEWRLNDQFITSGSPSYPVNETNYGTASVNQRWTLYAVNRITRSAGQAVEKTGCSTSVNYSYTIWPEATGPNDFTVSETKVRSGKKILLGATPVGTGGYENQWVYSWSINGAWQDVNASAVNTSPTVSNSNGMNTMTNSYGMRAYNAGPTGEGNWFDRTYTAKSVTIYAAPETPAQLLIKGNGTTHTLIAMSSLSDASLESQKYKFVFGYRDPNGNYHDLPATAYRYQRFDPNNYPGFNDYGYDYYVYTVWSYPDGSTVTSTRRYLSNAVDDFDGSIFDGSSRGDQASLEDVDVDDNELYVDSRGFKAVISNPSPAIVSIVNTAGKQVFFNQYPAMPEIVDTFGPNRLVPGVYIVTLKAGNTVITKKAIIK